jgi:hypothetical protein
VVDGVRSPAPKLDESHEEPSTCKFILFQINGIDAAEKVVVRRHVAASAHGRFWHSTAVQRRPLLRRLVGVKRKCCERH